MARATRAISKAGRLAGTSIRLGKEDQLDYRLENDPRFFQRIEQARASLRAGLGVRLEDLE
jgi:hypothetical protein